MRNRMIQQGYVRDLPLHIKSAGGNLVSVEPLPHSLNPLNPTYFYVVEPVHKGTPSVSSAHLFRCPRSGYPLQKKSHYWWSEQGGLAYPEIEGIACFREKQGLLMSHGL